MDREIQKAYEKQAVDIVIKYAREQGVKLRYSDFPVYTSDRTGNVVRFLEGSNPLVTVFINNEGRWGAQLKRAQDGFLNYINARVLKTGVKFSFAIKELDLLKMKGENEEAEPEGDIEKVIRKITKLLALSDLEKNPSENEAISASLAAQKLLAKYNLSIADITGENMTREEIEQVVADVGTGNKWKYSLSYVVAENYACKAYSHGADMIIFYGYKADILIARRVFVYLFKVGNRLANQYLKKYREQTEYTGGVYNSFARGFTDGVRKELEKQCTALALVIQPEVKESWDTFSAAFKTVNRSVTAINNNAYHEGRIEGKRALNAQYLEEDVTGA